MQLNWETRLLLVCRLGTGCSVPVELAIKHGLIPESAMK